MKIDHLFYIVGGTILLITLLTYMIYNPGGTSKVANWIHAYGFQLIFLMVMFDVLISPQAHSNYSIYSDQRLWKKYHLPQIDSSMHLIERSDDKTYYRTSSENPIIHYSKKMTHDMFDIYSIEDLIMNRVNKESLRIEFIKPNLLRDSMRSITLENHLKDVEDGQIRTLDFKQLDSVLNNWGLKNSIYKKLKTE